MYGYTVKKRARNDFQSTFEACAQTPNLDFEAAFFEVFQESHRVRASRSVRAEKQRKSTQTHASEGPKSSQDSSKSLFGRSFEQLRASKSSRQANRAARSSQASPFEQPDRARRGQSSRQIELAGRQVEPSRGRKVRSLRPLMTIVV